MIITDFKRNVVQLNSNAKKKENTIEVTKILKTKIYSFWYMMYYVRDHHLFANPKTDLTHNETEHNRFLKLKRLISIHIIFKIYFV